MTGSTYGSASPPSLAARLRAKPNAMPIGPASSSPLAASVRWIHWYAVPTAKNSAAAIDASPTSAPCIGRRLPNRMMTPKAMPGISGISQACSRNQPAGSSAAVTEVRQPFISLSSSREIDRRLRYTSRTSPRPTPTSAAATAMT